MMKTAKVMVTAAGSIVSQGIIKSLKLANNNSSPFVSYSITATDASPLAAGLYRCNKGYLVPRAVSSEYIESIVQICRESEIQAIFVGSDDELLALADSRGRIQSESGALVIAGSSSILSVARDKWKTYEFCKRNQVPCAPTSLPEDQAEFLKEFGFPVVVKPREGYGSVQFHIANSNDEVKTALHNIERVGWKPIIQQYIGGDEFTSGVTVDRTGSYVMSSISIRKILKHGQTHQAFIDDYVPVRKSAEDAALKLGLVGPVNIQVRMDNENPLVIEINPRFSATCPMRAVAGINEPDIVFRNFLLREEIKPQRYESLVCMRYWNEVYLPKGLFKEASSSDDITKSSSGSFIPDYF